MLETFVIVIVVTTAGGAAALSGFGLSTILIPVTALFYPLPEALLFVGAVHWFGDLWKLVLFREGLRWRLILSVGLPGILATVIGARLVFSVSSALLSRVLGLFLLLYVVFLFARSALHIRPRPATGAVGGALSGFFAGIFGMGGAIRAAFLSAFDLPRMAYLATTGAVALAVDSARLLTYIQEGARLESHLPWGMLLFVPASFLGSRLARTLGDRIPQRHVRKVVAAFLLIVGLRLLISAGQAPA